MKQRYNLKLLKDDKRSTWEKTRKNHLRWIDEVKQEELPRKLHLTDNRKTGVSVDFPVHATCTPTAVCAGASNDDAPCYALVGFMGYPNAVRQQARNQRLVAHLETAPYAEVCRVADALYSELPRGRDWLRWNGAGDLTPGAVRLINTFTRRHPDIIVWVITRKPIEARKLRDRASLRILFSQDMWTPAANKIRFRRLRKKFVLGVARRAYTRTTERDIPPPGTWVVFNRHVGGYFNDWEHKNVCPASLPGTDHVDACEDCRRCFKERKVSS